MSGYHFEQLKIVLVDDNPHMRRLVFAILHSVGVHDIFGAADAEHAWTLLTDIKPDIMILDWMLGGMSGLELTKKIRNDPASPDPLIPIVMLTGYTSKERVQEARDAGVSEILTKPVSAREILTRLVAVIERPRHFVRAGDFVGPDRRRRREQEYEGPERRDGKPNSEKVAS